LRSEKSKINTFTMNAIIILMIGRAMHGTQWQQGIIQVLNL
jgi:hypothetical protein